MVALDKMKQFSAAASSGSSLAGENFTAVQRIHSTDEERGFMAIIFEKNCSNPDLTREYGIENLPDNEMINFLENFSSPDVLVGGDGSSRSRPSKKFVFLQVVNRGREGFKFFSKASEHKKMVIPLTTYLRLLGFFQTEGWGEIVLAAEKEMRRNSKLQLEGNWICKDIYHSFYWVFEELGPDLDLVLQIGSANCVGVSLIYLNKAKSKLTGGGEISLDLYLIGRIAAGHHYFGAASNLHHEMSNQPPIPETETGLQNSKQNESWPLQHSNSASFLRHLRRQFLHRQQR